MEATLKGMEPKLAQVMSVIAKVVAEISGILRQQDDVTALMGGSNLFGDEQLAVDCAVDELIFKRLGECSACAAASSEEQPDMRKLQGDGFTVVFDPLDGSSVVGANFAVGTIFGVWPGSDVVGRCGRQQAAAAYAVYGPRTLLVWACPGPGGLTVQQWALGGQDTWKLLPPAGQVAAPHTSSNGPSPASGEPVGQACLIADTKPIFAPANLRCCHQNPPYRALVDKWVDQNFTLRYTGGMVPDVHHIIAKGGGVFVNPSSSGAPAKLRLVYECAPLAFIIEAAGGASHDGQTSILDIVISATTHKSTVVLGSKLLVQECLPAMQHTS